VFEVRQHEGYGARWSADGSEFRGFLEPQMEGTNSLHAAVTDTTLRADGHSKGESIELFILIIYQVGFTEYTVYSMQFIQQ
jgi:hypothetical protein